MSFRQRFTTNYKAGDLIYGLGDKITLLANQLIPGFRFKTSKDFNIIFKHLPVF